MSEKGDKVRMQSSYIRQKTKIDIYFDAHGSSIDNHMNLVLMSSSWIYVQLIVNDILPIFKWADPRSVASMYW